MHYRRPPLAACAAALCLIAVTGCASSQTEQFRAGYVAARAQLNRTFADLTTTFAHAEGKTLAQLTGSVGTLADRFGKELPAIEALKAPARVATAFTALTTSLNRVESDLQRTYAALNTKDFVAAGQALGSLQSDATAATDAATVVTRKLDHK